MVPEKEKGHLFGPANQRLQLDCLEAESPFGDVSSLELLSHPALPDATLIRDIGFYALNPLIAEYRFRYRQLHAVRVAGLCT